MCAFMRIPVDKLFADDKYQRVIQENRAAKIARDWSPGVAGLVTVSERSNGMYAIIDGDHRARGAAIRREKTIWAEVFFGLTPEQEAKLFHDRNTERKGLTPMARFKSSLASNDPAALDILRITQEAGYGINVVAQAPRNPNNFDCIASIEKVYKWGVLKETLELLRLAWPDHKRAGESSFILAIGTIAYHHGKQIDRNRWQERMEIISPTQLIAEAKALRVGLGRTEFSHIAELAVKEYNKRLQHKLGETIAVPNPGRLKGRPIKGEDKKPQSAMTDNRGRLTSKKGGEKE